MVVLGEAETVDAEAEAEEEVAVAVAVAVAFATRAHRTKSLVCSFFPPFCLLTEKTMQNTLKHIKGFCVLLYV